MAWWKRRQREETVRSPQGPTSDVKAVREHFAAFCATRVGVEAYVEPPTHVTGSTVILIASDGEWTRRAVATRATAFEVPRSMGLPTYDVNQTGYPQRMRDWNARQRRR